MPFINIAFIDFVFTNITEIPEFMNVRVARLPHRERTNTHEQPVI
jgi:hypothetical protein